jgi:outer membrane protein assembly factor BamE (lipoprotein component of BamABCDE complex)
MRANVKRIAQRLAIILAALTLIFGLELARERFVYRRIARKLESAHAQLKTGMTKDEVKAIAGEPEEIAQRKPDEYWTWSSRGHEGELWRRIGMTSTKGHYDLIVRFDGENRITKIFGGLN